MKCIVQNYLNNFVNCLTIDSVKEKLVNQFIARRKECKLSQKEIANRSGVSYASVRRFESTGQISLDSLLKLSRVIECLSDFVTVFSNPRISNLKERYEKYR